MVKIANKAIKKDSFIIIKYCGDAGNWTRVRKRTIKDTYTHSHSINLMRIKAEWRANMLTILKNTSNNIQELLFVDLPLTASNSNHRQIRVWWMWQQIYAASA